MELPVGKAGLLGKSTVGHNPALLTKDILRGRSALPSRQPCPEHKYGCFRHCRIHAHAVSGLSHASAQSPSVSPILIRAQTCPTSVSRTGYNRKERNLAECRGDVPLAAGATATISKAPNSVSLCVTAVPGRQNRSETSSARFLAHRSESGTVAHPTKR